MAVRAWTRVASGNDRTLVYELDAALTNADTVGELDLSGFNEPIVECEADGTFDSATFVFQGGNATGNAAQLKDTQGNDLSFTALGGGICARMPLFLTGAASGGGVSQSLTPRVTVRV